MMLMQLAPSEGFCLLAKIFFTAPVFDLIQQLLAYFLTVVAALIFHAAVIYALLLRVLLALVLANFFTI